MNILNSLKEFFAGAGTGRKIATGGSIFGVIALVSLLLVWSSKPKMELLYGGLSDEDMPKVLSVVQASGVKYKTAESGNGIQVPKEKVHELRIR